MNKTLEHLTHDQYDMAFDWCGMHLMHIGRAIDNLTSGYPPSVEDKSNPRVWKPEHWFWFLKNLDVKDIELSLDINTLEHVKMLFDFHSDSSTHCNGYYQLIELIKTEKIKINK